MKNELDKSYNPQDHEERVYQLWIDSGFFNPDNLALPEDAPSYTIVLPPPNITDKLHMGHAAMVAIEDLLIRYKRLSGFRALWLPGTDHASIATQNVVERKILKERGKTRHDLGRAVFLAEVHEFLKTTQSEILNQIRRLGASLDWSRLAFTLDDERQAAVRRMFKDMYEAGIIYRGERVVNWCPRCHSTLADDEVDYKEEKSKLYWLKYGPFVLATTRPETKLGDTAVAVHPEDERYRSWVGQELDIRGVLGNFRVKVVADRAVDREFGTGIIKVTPAHDFTDNEIAMRHGLAMKKIIDEDGKMMANCGKYAGLSTKQAREAIVVDMQDQGLIDHIEDNYIHNAAVCYRCGSVIEPLPSKQWFVSVDKKIEKLGGLSLKEKALAAARNEEISFLPARFAKRYCDWMENLHDWCISRQIWFGHRVPVWYRGEEISVGESAPEGDGWAQDEDTLDTWFSSSLWTFSTLGWPENYQANKKSGDLAKFHPTQVLETGYEIITLWVSRMIMMSYFALGESPFRQVYLHGMILDNQGKKMSKSKGNGVDPLLVIKDYGADATRLSIITGSTPGNDSRFSLEKVEAKRNLVNKLWNVSRFILSLEEDEGGLSPTLADRWILLELDKLIAQATKRLDNFEFSLAADDLQEFTWNKLADWYLEIAKIEKGKRQIARTILKKLLVLWHPFLPYVTEVIWQSFNDSMLMVSSWPQVQLSDEESEEEDFHLLQEIIVAIRNVRSENKIEPAKKLVAVIYSADKAEFLQRHAPLLCGLKTGLSRVDVSERGEKPDQAILATAGGIEIYLLGAVDPTKELARLQKEAAELESLISRQRTKLENGDFIMRAPDKVVLLEKNKLASYQADLAKINNIIKSL